MCESREVRCRVAESRQHGCWVDSMYVWACVCVGGSFGWFLVGRGGLTHGAGLTHSICRECVYRQSEADACRYGQEFYHIPILSE